jgi:hypothetical protein
MGFKLCIQDDFPMGAGLPSLAVHRLMRSSSVPSAWS